MALNPLQMQNGPWGAVQNNAAMIQQGQGQAGGQWDQQSQMLHQERMARMQADMDMRAQEHVANLQKTMADEAQRMDTRAALSGEPMTDEFIQKQKAAREQLKELSRKVIESKVTISKLTQEGIDGFNHTKSILRSKVAGTDEMLKHLASQRERLRPQIDARMRGLTTGMDSYASNVDPSIAGRFVAPPGGMGNFMLERAKDLLPIMEVASGFRAEGHEARQMEFTPEAFDILSDDDLRREGFWLSVPSGHQRDVSRGNRALAALATDMATEMIPMDNTNRNTVRAALEDVFFLTLNMSGVDGSDASYAANDGAIAAVEKKMTELQQLGVDVNTVAYVMKGLGDEWNQRLVGQAAGPDGAGGEAGILQQMQDLAPNPTEWTPQGALMRGIQNVFTDTDAPGQVSRGYKEKVLERAMAEKFSSLARRVDVVLPLRKYDRVENTKELLKFLEGTEKKMINPETGELVSEVRLPTAEQARSHMGSRGNAPGIRDILNGYDETPDGDAMKFQEEGLFGTGKVATLEAAKREAANYVKDFEELDFDNPEWRQVTPGLEASLEARKAALRSRAQQEQMQGVDPFS